MRDSIKALYLNKGFHMSNRLEIQSKKIELIQWLSTIDDVAVLDKITELITQENKKDWGKELSTLEIESIEKGQLDASLKKVNPHSKARDIYGKWL